MIHLAVNIFDRNPGLEFLARWAHVVVGIAWIGILFYFNFVQVPRSPRWSPAPATTRSTSSRRVPCGGSAGLPPGPS